MIDVDGERLLARLDELATIGATPTGGVTREAYGADDRRARDLVGEWMAAAGLAVEVDAATNVVGRRARAGGNGTDGTWVGTGSHVDTVVDAGALDGAYGVVAGVEVAAALADRPLARGLVVVAFANEEGARGTDGMVGSRALVGDVAEAELAVPDDAGVTLADRLVEAGGDPEAIAGAAWDLDRVAAFVELHIEQGPVLEAHGEDLGVVTAITGRQAVDIEVRGAANHAGTTPMDLRHDALAAAAEVVLGVEALARRGAVRVATCGHVAVAPNVRNVVPGTVRLSAELRDTDPAVLAAACAALADEVATVAARRAVEVDLAWGQLVPPVGCDPAVVAAVTAAAERTGRPFRCLPSGAGHDAQILAPHVPTGMLFVPSVGGVSHSPQERTDPDHLVLGARALLATILTLAEATS